MTALRQRMQDDLQLRNYSEHTIRAYLHCVAEFARHFHPAPEHLGPEHIRTYQLYLVQQKKVAWATCNQAVCALRFFSHTTLGVAWMIEHIPYPRRQKKLPHSTELRGKARVLHHILDISSHSPHGVS